MENMFSGKSEKRIPKTLKECVKEDGTANDLHLWAERLENWGMIILCIIIIVGIVSTIISTVAVAEVGQGAPLITFLSSVLTWGLYAFLEYIIYHIIALLLSALALITQNLIISANVALYESERNACVQKNTNSTQSNPAFSKNAKEISNDGNAKEIKDNV